MVNPITLSLKQNFVWAFLGNAVSAFLMWLLLVVLTKCGSVEMVGVYGVAQAVGLPISMFLSLKLQMVQVTDARNEFRFGDYLTIRLFTSAAAVIITAAAGFLFYSYDTALIIFLMGISYAIIAVRETFLGVMQKAERMDLMTLSRVMESGFSLILFGLLYFITRNLAMSTIGLIAARLMVVFLYDIPTARKSLSAANMQFKPHWDGVFMLKLFKVAAPLGFVALCTTLYTSIPRLVLDQYEGKARVGYFVAISSLLVIGTMVTAALSQTSSPRLAKYYVENIKAYKILIMKLTGAATLLGIFGVVASFFFGRWLLAHMFKPEYADYNHVFVMMTFGVAVLFLYTFMNDSLAAARKFRIQFAISSAAVVTCLVSSLIFIPQYGMTGAVFSILACYTAGLTASAISVVIVYRKRVKEMGQGGYPPRDMAKAFAALDVDRN